MTDRTLADRLLDAQRAVESPSLDGKNPHFNSRFATLGEVTRVAKDALNAAGIVVLQPVVTMDDGRVGVSTIFACGSERMDAGTLAARLPDDPQKIGGAITYFRRYGLASAFALVADEDDDAESLMQAHRPNPPRPAAPGRSEGKPQPSEPPVLDIDDDAEWAAVLGDVSAPDADGTCPVHGTAWKRYPAGVSKKTGKPYEAGWSCETFGCREHPSDGWKARHAA